MLSAFSVNQIISSVDREVQLHLKYLELIFKEREAVTMNALENCFSFGAKREALCGQISAERSKRGGLLRSVGGDNIPERLSDFIKVHFLPADQRRMIPLIEKLKKLVREVHAENQEFSQVLNFSLGIVTSSLSILRSANQEVQRGYTGRGVVRESVHPVTREAGVLRQA